MNNKHDLWELQQEMVLSYPSSPGPNDRGPDGKQKHDP